MDYMMMGRQIRNRRRELRLTQERLAEAVSISPTFLGHIERGTRKCSVETLYRICSTLELDANAVIGLIKPQGGDENCQTILDQMQSIFDELTDLIEQGNSLGHP